MRRDQRSEEARAWRKLYKDPRWEPLRQFVFRRDLYTCQRCGILCRGKHPAPNSPACNHIGRHKGDVGKFFDPSACECLCKQCHDSEVQAEESVERVNIGNAVGADGWPLNPEHILYTGKKPERRNTMTHPSWLRPSKVPLTLVCGPPGAGKSTYVREHGSPDDLVIDMDQIAARLYPSIVKRLRPNAQLDREQFIQVLKARNEMLADLTWRKNAHRWPKAWFIIGEPRKDRRQWWADKMKPEAIVVLETPQAVCEARARQATRTGDARSDGAVRAIARWWRTYEPRPGDVRVRHTLEV